MMTSRWTRLFIPIFLSLFLLVSACAPNPPSRYEQVQKETTQRKAPGAVAKQAEQGAKFNKFFPSGVRGYDIVPAQEKKGFAEYKVNQDGKTVAMLSISDTSSLPSAAAKYQNSASTIAGYPAVEQGTTATGILVNGRYQVKVQSRDPSFSKDDRAAWLQKFNLRGLSQLSAALTPQKSPPWLKAPALTPQPAT